MRLNPCDTAFKKRLIPRSVPIRPEKNIIIDGDFVAQGHAVLEKTFKLFLAISSIATVFRNFLYIINSPKRFLSNY